MSKHAIPSAITRLFFVAILVGTASAASAQTGDAQLAILDPIRRLFPKPVERFAPGGPEEKATAPTEKPVIMYRSARRISAAYAGCVIELASADRPLLHDNPIFKKFGNVQYDRTAEGKYSYFILVPFSSKKAIESFFEVVIKPRNPEAKIVEYKDGKRDK